MIITFLQIFAVCFSQTLRTRCEVDVRAEVANKVKICKSKATVKFGDRSMVRNFRNELRAYENDRKSLQYKLCEKVEAVYRPNGLLIDIPSNWGCHYDNYTWNLMEEIRNQKFSINPGKNVFNIVLVGKTGAGKSYFANALLGSFHPFLKEGEDVFFPAMDGLKSVTQHVSAQTGKLFGGYYDNQLGISESIDINVFDTPGFDDANIENIAKNKLLIANSLQEDIHLVIYLSALPRFDAKQQENLKILNDWTAGKLWNNLLLVKGRTKFDFHDVENRFKNGNSVFQQKDTTYFTNLLYKRAIAEEHWTKKSIVGNRVQTNPLTRADLAQIKISLLNMSQHKECISNEKRTPTDKCWKMPKDYYYYDEETFDYQLTFDDDKSVFIEEAKLFYNILLEMKKHPIEPSAQIFKIELNNDIDRFNKVLTREKEIDEKQAEISNQGPRLTAAYTECENEEIDLSNCPVWLKWSDWTQCGKCGSQSVQRQRIGCTIHGEPVDTAVCESNFAQSKYELKLCEGLPKCPDNAKLLKEYKEKAAREAQQAKEQIDLLTETINKNHHEAAQRITDLQSTQTRNLRELENRLELEARTERDALEAKLEAEKREQRRQQDAKMEALRNEANEKRRALEIKLNAEKEEQKRIQGANLAALRREADQQRRALEAKLNAEKAAQKRIQDAKLVQIQREATNNRIALEARLKAQREEERRIHNAEIAKLRREAAEESKRTEARIAATTRTRGKTRGEQEKQKDTRLIRGWVGKNIFKKWG